ncbi:PAS domain S-box protein [Microvirga massiliensis]|uniref:PAS domain S-box protein n=1 Tax=Microvirga massiliensis TaxID=1033741 RepID=UPI00093FF468|nr:PAS domain S-box protein [Microvirga massiliensis]
MRLYHPEDIARMQAVREAGSTLGTAYEAECRVRRHDGVYRWHRLSLTPIKTGDVISGWVGASLDIHELREAQEELRAFANRLQLAQEAAGAGNWDLDLTTWEIRLCLYSVRSHGLPEEHSGEIPLRE